MTSCKVVIAVISLASSLLGQAVSVAEAEAEATGTVLDPAGSAVVGATVKMIETAKGISHNGTTDSMAVTLFLTSR